MSVFLCIATLLSSNLTLDDIISFLNRVEINSLKQYLQYAKIYTGSGIKSKNQLIEMIIYGFMCEKIINIQSIEDINTHNFKQTIEKCNINISKLPGYDSYSKKKKIILLKQELQN